MASVTDLSPFSASRDAFVSVRDGVSFRRHAGCCLEHAVEMVGAEAGMRRELIERRRRLGRLDQPAGLRRSWPCARCHRRARSACSVCRRGTRRLRPRRTLHRSSRSRATAGAPCTMGGSRCRWSLTAVTNVPSARLVAGDDGRPAAVVGRRPCCVLCGRCGAWGLFWRVPCPKHRGARAGPTLRSLRSNSQSSDVNALKASARPSRRRSSGWKDPSPSRRRSSSCR